MTNRSVLFWLALGSAACTIDTLPISATDASPGAGGDAGAEARSCPSADGSRLAQVWRTPADGTRQPVGIFDTELGQRCEPVAMPGGFYRCVPTDRGGATNYTDADCSRPVARMFNLDSGIPAYHIEEARGAQRCDLGPQIREIGDRVYPDVLYLLWSDGRCEPTNSGGSYFALGEAINESLAVVKRRTSGDGRLVGEYFVGEDDSRLCLTDPDRVRFYDAGLETRCRILHDEDGDLRCLPEGFAAIQRHSEASCALEVTVAHQSECEDQRFATGVVDAFCGNGMPVLGMRIFEVSEPLAEPVYFDSGLGCRLDPTPYRRANQAVAPDTFPAVARVELGAGRLRPIAFSAGQGYATTTGTFYDSELAIYCDPFRLEDRSWRCLPERAQFIDAFADDECEQPITVARATPSRCADLAGNAYATRWGSNAERTVFSLGGERPSPPYQKLSSGCRPIAGQWRYYDVIEQLDASLFAELDESHE